MQRDTRSVENKVIWIMFMLISICVTGFLLWMIYQFQTESTQIQQALTLKTRDE